MKCPKCGEEIKNDTKFCTKCGANIELALEERVKAETEAKKKKEEQAKLEQKKKAEAEAKAKAEEKAKEKEVAEAKDASEEKTTEGDVFKGEEKKFDKKNSKPKKKHTGLKIILVLIIILLVFIAGTYGLYKIDKLPDSLDSVLSPIFETVEGWFGIEKDTDEEEKKDKETNNETQNEVTNEVAGIAKIDEDEELVYDAFTIEIDGEESVIPAINLDCDYAEEINEELMDEARDALEDAADLEEDDRLGLMKTYYDWAQNDDVLSLVFTMEYGTGVAEYFVYNINIVTGEEVENSEILEMAKLDEDEFVDKCVEAAEDYFDKLYDPEDSSITSASYYTEAREETTDEDNFSKLKSDRIYLNKNGQVTVIAEITTLAGAGYTEVALNIENTKKNTVDASSNTSNTTNSTEEVTNNTTNSSDNVINSAE